MKLRIGLMVVLMAVMGYVAVADKVNPVQLAVLSLAMLLGSASSSVFNHFYDRDIDLIMKRTRSRPLASGQTQHPAHVLWFAAALLVSGCGLAALYFNIIVALHLFLGIFFYAIIYTVWLKRRHWINIVIGGAAGSFAVLAGAAAVDSSHWLLPCLLSITLFLWTPSHFWSLAILLKDDYPHAARRQRRQDHLPLDLRQFASAGGVLASAGRFRRARQGLWCGRSGFRRPFPLDQLADGAGAEP
jgi:protoheme IX farnesyltransferase